MPHTDHFEKWLSGKWLPDHSQELLRGCCSPRRCRQGHGTTAAIAGVLLDRALGIRKSFHRLSVLGKYIDLPWHIPVRRSNSSTDEQSDRIAITKAPIKHDPMRQILNKLAHIHQNEEPLQGHDDDMV